MEFGLNPTSSASVEDVSSKHTEQRNTAELSNHDMTLLSSMHCTLFVQLASANWFHGDKTLLPKINIVWPYLLGYHTAAVLVRHCAHLLSK